MPGLPDNMRWSVLSGDEGAERLLSEELGISPLVARIMVARGIRTVEDARVFLNPSLDRDWVDPLEIPGMKEATDRVERALDQRERIAVFGDFDVDGMTSTALLTQALRRFGGRVDPYIPHRFGEGYGLSRAALERVIEGSHPDLVVTVDNGIAAAEEVAWLVSQGVDVVITDHHEPGDLVPRGVPVTDPKLSLDCPSRELAGAGVALKLVYELGRRRGQPDLWRDYIDLAALGTVSDMMLLEGENRSLVAEGMDMIRHSTRPGIVALAATVGTDMLGITADNLPFSLIPRLNAAGRMGTTEVAFDLLVSEDPAEATILAGKLEQTNTMRRDIEASLSQEALTQTKSSFDKGKRVVVLAGEGWHEGVKGIVASRVVNKCHVPAIVFSVNDGIARGSGRSVGSVDLFHAVEQCADLLVRFGGHSGAVGVTCEVDNIGAFRERLGEVLAELPKEQFIDRGEVAAMATLDELTQDGIDALECLQPFGQGNKRPLLGVCGVFMRNRARVGYDGSHLRFVATDGAHSIPAIMFRTPQMERAYECEGIVDLVVDAINETWQGRTQPKLMVRDIIYRDAEHAQKKCLVDELLSCDKSPRKEALDSTPTNAVRKDLSRFSVSGLTQRLCADVIGSKELHPAQRAALDTLAAGRSCLCVMATGRGKSLIFHIHSARLAIRERKASVFVYPLRALVSDQSFHLTDVFARWGLAVRVLTGETRQDKRDEYFQELYEGTVDTILTTPEFLSIHRARFARSGRIGFVVVDEAHHAASSQGTRTAYAELPEVLRAFGNPTVLAATATAPTPVAREICRLLSIDEKDVVVDRSLRPNLNIVDHRELRDRDTLLASLVASGQKTVVYVNSRDASVAVARMLRAGVPELGHAIAFYHAGLSRDLRLRVEREFRDGRLSCIVSTSAFGEGVNLPHIRNVVLYHMPFGATEFNQTSGRAGRDGADASIHLLYGSRDAHINDAILTSMAPARDDLVTLYRALMTQARATADGVLRLDDAQLLSVSQSIDCRTGLIESSVASGVSVFEELGFLRQSGFGENRCITMVASPGHVELEQSIRYAEGQHAREEFSAFRDWALSSLSQEILNRINRPIVPGFGRVVDR